MLTKQQDKITGSHIESGLYSKYAKSLFTLNTFLNSSYFQSLLSPSEIKEIYKKSKDSIDFFKKAARLHLQNTGKTFFVEKTPSHTLFWKDINKDFSSPKIILIKRTPAAVIHSMTTAEWSRLLSDKLPFPLNNVSLFRYSAAILKFYKYNSQIKSIQRSPNVLTLNYEDIILEKVDIQNTLKAWLQIKINDIYISRPYSAEVDHKQKGFDKNRVASYQNTMPKWAQLIANLLFD